MDTCTFSSPDFLDHIFTLHALLLSLEFFLYFARQKSYILQEYSGLLHTWSAIFVLVRCLYTSFDTITPYLCILNQQCCRLHITTSLRIFSFFNLDIKMVILIFFLPQVLAGLFFCNCILFPY